MTEAECDDCGEMFPAEDVVVVEIDPPIKITGYNYPHKFEVCPACAEKLVEDKRTERRTTN